MQTGQSGLETSVPDLSTELVTQTTGLLTTHDNISRVLSELDLPIDQLVDGYSTLPSHSFDFDAILRVFLYKHIADYSDSELSRRLENWPYLRQRFGLDRPPRQQTLSYTWRRRFDQDLRRLITTTATGIRTEAHDQGIVSKEITPPDPEEVDVDEHGKPTSGFTTKQVLRTTRLARDHGFSAFETGRAANSTYSDQLIHDFHAKMSMETKWGTPTTARSFKRNPARSADEEIHHDTHLRAIKKLATPADYQYTLDEFDGPSARSSMDWGRIRDTIQLPLNTAVGSMLSAIKGTEMFRQPAVVAIDITHIPFYSSPWKDPEDVGPDDEPVLVNGTLKYPEEGYPEMVSGLRKSTRAATSSRRSPSSARTSQSSSPSNP